MGEGEGKKLVQYCNQWPAMLDFESMFDVGFQVLKYYFYVSVSFAGSVFTLAKLGRLVVSDEYVELFDGLCSFCVLRCCTHVDFFQVSLLMTVLPI